MAGSEGQHDESEATAVTICGQTYHLRGSDDPRYLVDLASFVDRRMREVVEATGTADSQKVAILAALNIADDYLQASSGAEGAATDPRSEERLARMVALLDEALAG